MHWYLFIDITLSLGFKASTCLVHFSGGKRSGLLSVFWFLHAYWTMNLSVLALVNHFPEFVQYHFLGSLSCFYVVEKTAFSRICCALPNVSEETKFLFILRDYALAGIEVPLIPVSGMEYTPITFYFRTEYDLGTHQPSLFMSSFTLKCGFCTQREIQ